MTLARDERGFVLVTAMIVLLILLSLSTAVFYTVNVQTDQTGHERSGEAAFDLADSALRAEVYQLQLSWPSTQPGMPTNCSNLLLPKAGCEGSALSSDLSTAAGIDYAHATWWAQAFDNSVTNPYSPVSATPGPAPGPASPWDLNGDETMWVRAQATANGQTRTVVEEVRRLAMIPLAQNLVTAGGLYTKTGGNPPIMDATDATGLTGAIDVRCDSVTAPQAASYCLGWSSGQLTNPSSAYASAYVDSSGSSTLSNDEIQSLTNQAQAAGALLSGCPSPGDPRPLIVVTGAVHCTYSSNGNGSNWYSPTSPGMLVFLNSGAWVSFGGGTFNGLLYMVNQGGTVPPCSATQLNATPMVTLSGSAQLVGSIFVGGCGTVYLQDEGNSLTFSSAALKPLPIYQAATPVQGTFQIVPNQ